jgi:hypothetical protein
VYGVLFALLGGYVGTVISRKLWVGLTISVIMAAGAVTSMIATGFSWSPIAALIFMVPAAVVGGWLRLRRQ